MQKAQKERALKKLEKLGKSRSDFSKEKRAELEKKNKEITESIKKDYAKTVFKGINEEEIEKRGRIDIIGKKVKNVHELAALAQIYRDPRFETFRVFYTKGDVIVQHEAFTARTPTTVNPPPPAALIERIYTRMKDNGADGFYISHNHPSGSVVPSAQDIYQVKNIIHFDNKNKFKGNFIIDHNKYAYISWNDDLNIGINYGKIKGSTKDPLINYLGNVPRTPDEIAELLASLKDTDRFGAIVYHTTDNKGFKTIGLQHAPLSLFSNYQIAKKFLQKGVLEFGGSPLLVIKSSKLNKNKLDNIKKLVYDTDLDLHVVMIDKKGKLKIVYDVDKLEKVLVGKRKSMPVEEHKQILYNKGERETRKYEPLTDKEKELTDALYYIHKEANRLYNKFSKLNNLWKELKAANKPIPKNTLKIVRGLEEEYIKLLEISKKVIREEEKIQLLKNAAEGLKKLGDSLEQSKQGYQEVRQTKGILEELDKKKYKKYKAPLIGKLKEKYIEHVGDPVWNFLSDTIPEYLGDLSPVIDSINRGLITDYKKDPYFLKIRDIYKNDMYIYKQAYDKLARNMSKLNKAEQIRMSQIIRGSVTTNPNKYKDAYKAIEEFHKLEKELLKRGLLKDTRFRQLTKKEINKALKNVDEINKKLIDDGILSESEKFITKVKDKNGNTYKFSTTLIKRTRNKNNALELKKIIKQRQDLLERIQIHYKMSGKEYLRIAYNAIENQKHIIKRLYNIVTGKRLIKGYNVARKELSEEYIKNKLGGEIKQAPYLVYKGLSEERHDVELSKMFNVLYANKELVLTPEDYLQIQQYLEMPNEFPEEVLVQYFIRKKMIKKHSKTNLENLKKKI